MKIKYQVGFVNCKHKQYSRDIVYINFETNTIGFWAINSLGKKKIFERNLNDVKLMRFTERKDKNGEDIFEGDILRGGAYLSYEVKWDENSNGWNIVNEYNIRTNYEIIGNIYGDQV